ncbi:hypothetical protein [Embleya sp. NPDC059237]|uniref:hypothetical protein n=1 Tax=Embleya sp. NPDC059237 TaxID=3346784 RepID=UPI00369D8214
MRELPADLRILIEKAFAGDEGAGAALMHARNSIAHFALGELDADLALILVLAAGAHEEFLRLRQQWGAVRSQLTALANLGVEAPLEIFHEGFDTSGQGPDQDAYNLGYATLRGVLGPLLMNHGEVLERERPRDLLLRLMRECGGEWTAARAVDAMSQMGWHTASERPSNVTGNLLTSLEHEGVIRRVRRGVYAVDASRRETEEIIAALVSYAEEMANEESGQKRDRRTANADTQ